jgi:hypothetical protein
MGIAFLVVLHRSGPKWNPELPLEEQSEWPAHASFMDGLVDVGFVILGGPLSNDHRVVLAIEADSEGTIRETLARDPWSETHLVIESIDAWIIRLDGRAERSGQVRAGGRDASTSIRAEGDGAGQGGS